MSVNFSKNQEEIIKAWRQVVDSKDAQNWALFGYEGTTNNIKLVESGSDGLKGLVQEFNCSLIQYAFVRVIDKELGINKLVLINWQGDSSPLSRKGLCASHVGDIVSYFKGCTQTITIRNDDEATPEYLMDQIVKASSSRVSLSKAHSNSGSLAVSSDSKGEADSVSSSYNSKLDKSFEISSADRKSFWQRQEEEEKARLLEERKRAAEKQAQFERERKLKEESEAKKLAETIKERDRLIEATRQAERRESSSSSQPSSILMNNSNHDNDDERVGRRSELIRLERNQETQSLISKGLIKNKRAIFEQASQQQQTQQHSMGHSTTRRPSGTIITQRVSTFKSMDGSGAIASSSVDAEKLANGLTKSVNLQNLDSNKSSVKPVIQKEDQSMQLVREEEYQNSTTKNTVLTTASSSPIVEQRKFVENIQRKVETNDIQPPVGNGDKTANNTQSAQSNGTNNNNKPTKSPIQESNIDSEEVLINGDAQTRAKALYDYQAADNTEISFDPDDIIGCIDKVDSGWWHGTVISGKYKGQAGLFPANYVEEFNKSHEDS